MRDLGVHLASWVLSQNWKQEVERLWLLFKGRYLGPIIIRLSGFSWLLEIVICDLTSCKLIDIIFNFFFFGRRWIVLLWMVILCMVHLLVHLHMEFLKFSLKEVSLKGQSGWRGGPAVKSAGYFYRGVGSWFPVPTWWPTTVCTPVPGGSMSSPGFWGHQADT